MCVQLVPWRQAAAPCPRCPARLLWTTEKETLWILKNAGLFGTAAGDVYQARLPLAPIVRCCWHQACCWMAALACWRCGPAW